MNEKLKKIFNTIKIYEKRLLHNFRNYECLIFSFLNF